MEQTFWTNIILTLVMGTKSNQKFSYDKIKIRLQVRFIVSKEKQCLWIYADNFELIVVEAQKHQHRNYWKIIYNVYYLYYLCIIRGIVNHKGPTNSKLTDQHSKACITLVRLPTQAFPPSNFPTEAFLIVQLPPINSHQSVQSISAPGISRLIHVDSTKSFLEHRSRFAASLISEFDKLHKVYLDARSKSLV